MSIFGSLLKATNTRGEAGRPPWPRGTGARTGSAPDLAGMEERRSRYPADTRHDGSPDASSGRRDAAPGRGMIEATRGTEMMPWGGGAGPMQAAVTDIPSGAARARPRAVLLVKWAGWPRKGQVCIMPALCKPEGRSGKGHTGQGPIIAHYRTGRDARPGTEWGAPDPALPAGLPQTPAPFPPLAPPRGRAANSEGPPTSGPHRVPGLGWW